MTGLTITAAGDALTLAIAAPTPVVLLFSGETLAELTAACLKAFRAAGGTLFDKSTPDVCNTVQDERQRVRKGLQRMAVAWRTDVANDVSEFTRGVVAGRLGCAAQLERVLGDG